MKESAPKQKKPEGDTVASLIVKSIIALIGGTLSLTLKPVISWLFDLKEDRSLKVGIMLIVFGTIGFTLYKIPLFRNMTLSNTHTINYLSDGQRVFFPPVAYFVTESERRKFDGRNGFVYFTYSGYTKGYAQETSKGQCHMVPRGERKILASSSPPVRAEGFEDTVFVTWSIPISSLTRFGMLIEGLKNPSILWSDKHKKITTEENVSWRTFINSFYEIDQMKGTTSSDFYPFEVTALKNEHAVICF
ncbi:MAG: hypothetical protein RI935_703 [Candidatus Parcubacteria bacterium]|jgi:hypothetical protein